MKGNSTNATIKCLSIEQLLQKKYICQFVTQCNTIQIKLIAINSRYVFCRLLLTFIYVVCHSTLLLLIGIQMANRFVAANI